MFFVFWFLFRLALLSLSGVQNKQGKEKSSPVLDLFDIGWPEMGLKICFGCGGSISIRLFE